MLVLGAVVFEGFELLDIFGPIEMFGLLRDKVDIVMLAEKAGPSVIAERALGESAPLDIIMVPGGMGTRREVNNAAFVSALKQQADNAAHVTSVCTGSAVLAKTGHLDGRQATSNKMAFKWATSQGPAVKWVAEARWVEDGKYFTSSGISAGMDMSLALIAKLFGQETAETVARRAEYAWHQDKSWDPFAKMAGLESGGLSGTGHALQRFSGTSRKLSRSRVGGR